MGKPSGHIFLHVAIWATQRGGLRLGAAELRGRALLLLATADEIDGMLVLLDAEQQCGGDTQRLGKPVDVQQRCAVTYCCWRWLTEFPSTRCSPNAPTSWSMNRRRRGSPCRSARLSSLRPRTRRWAAPDTGGIGTGSGGATAANANTDANPEFGAT